MGKLLENASQKLREAREKCPGMSEELYALTDYMAEVTNESVLPVGLVMCLVCVLDDIQKGRNGFNSNEHAGRLHCGNW